MRCPNCEKEHPDDLNELRELQEKKNSKNYIVKIVFKFTATVLEFTTILVLSAFFVNAMVENGVVKDYWTGTIVLSFLGIIGFICSYFMSNDCQIIMSDGKDLFEKILEKEDYEKRQKKLEKKAQKTVRNSQE